jgi:hypothetical protein
MQNMNNNGMETMMFWQQASKAQAQIMYMQNFQDWCSTDTGLENSAP